MRLETHFVCVLLIGPITKVGFVFPKGLGDRDPDFPKNYTSKGWSQGL